MASATISRPVVRRFPHKSSCLVWKSTGSRETENARPGATDAPAHALLRSAATAYPSSTQPSRPYPSDLSDARWALIHPTLEAWRQARNGIRKPTHDLAP